MQCTCHFVLVCKVVNVVQCKEKDDRETDNYCQFLRIFVMLCQDTMKYIVA